MTETKPEIHDSLRKNLPTHAIEEPNFKLHLDINILQPQLNSNSLLKGKPRPVS